MLLHRSHLLSLLGLALATPSMASDSVSHLPHFLTGGDSVGSLQRAYQSVQENPVVKELLSDPTTHTLTLSSRVQAYGVETTKFQHYYKGLEVLGSMTFHHDSAVGAQVRTELSRFDLNVLPGITPNDAIALAKSIAGDRALNKPPELKILPAKSGEGSARLIYWVDMPSIGTDAGSDVLIDAHSGKLIAHLSKMETIAPIQVVSAKNLGLKILPVVKKNPKTGKPELKGCSVTDMAKNTDKALTIDQCKALLNGQSPDSDNQCQVVMMESDTAGDPMALDPASCAQVVTDSTANSGADLSARNALNNSTAVLNYYRDVHGRNSFDNAGGEVVNIVHAGINYGNAAWVKDLDFMMYGDGDGVEMGDMTTGLDVAGHEMTHGVTAKTAKLTMMDETGALNEAYSDFFGKMIAQDGTWVMGASLSLNSVKFPGIRNLANPHALSDTTYDGAGKEVTQPYPAKISEAIKKLPDTVCGAKNDRCWVHFNSTVPSHASYLVYQALGKSKAEALYYLTLTSYLTSEATFKTAAAATMQACNILLTQGRLGSGDCDQVMGAFQQVGMM